MQNPVEGRQSRRPVEIVRTLSFALRNGNFASGRQNLYTERSEEASVIELSAIRLIEVATEKQTCNKRRGYFTALPIPC
jgi:hypothetical protein